MADYSTLFTSLENASSGSSFIKRDFAYYLGEGFSEEQASVLTIPSSKHIAVLAGPGSGKTRVLVERVIHLLELGISPETILVCTFTRNAALEMKDRLEAILPEKRIPANIGTMHSLSYKLGVRDMPTKFLSDEEAQSIIGSLVDSLGFPANGRTPAELHVEINRAREEGHVKEWISPLYWAYLDMLTASHAQDFLVLLEKVVKSGSSRKFKHILVDEAQDLTQLQTDWLSAVSTANSRFFMVGDDDQSIYSFRGYQGGALQALKRNPATESRLLTNNFRSSIAVVTVANNVISHNWKRWPKVSNQRSTESGFVDPVVFEDVDAELLFLQTELATVSGICILGRTRKILEPFQQAGFTTMTLHESKGKEFDYVWLTGCEEKLMPHILEEDIEEERRLFYVGITRARHGAWLSRCLKRSRSQKASRFLLELNEYMPRPKSSAEESDW